MPSKKHKLVSGPEELKLAPFMRLLKAVHSMGEPESFTPEDLEKQRRSQDALGNMAASMSGLVWEPFTLAGMDAAWMAAFPRTQAAQGHPLLPRRRLHQRRPGFFQGPGLEAHPGHGDGHPRL